MPARRPDLSGEPPRRLGFGHRLLLALPRLGRGDKAPLGERIQSALLKPQEAPAGKKQTRQARIEELEAAVRATDDRERMIGLVAAPLAAAVGLLVVNADIANDPPATKNGRANPLHVSVGVYHEILVVLLVLALVALVAAALRRRLILGAGLALYGLAVVNLRYWGFGIPFMLGGAWFLARSYRLHQELKGLRAGGDGPGGPVRRNKRYTPPA
jgi:hypothetical protein